MPRGWRGAGQDGEFAATSETLHAISPRSDQKGAIYISWRMLFLTEEEEEERRKMEADSPAVDLGGLFDIELSMNRRRVRSSIVRI